MKLPTLLLVIAAACTLTIARADTGKHPNILWITSEDNSADWVGCYGNTEAQTPRLDRLATEGIRFLHAYSNGPVCAVARSTILNGVYAPSQGTQHMRSRHPQPAYFQSYVSYLRQLGYYCTNNAKTDYNFKGDDKAIWDDCSNKAHYRNRKEGQPFFAVFNLNSTHESSLFPRKNEGPTRLKPSEVKVMPDLPDLPEVRSDIARYHDRMTQMDGEVGALLDELAAAGLAEDTIVFYYSDHGGILPRSKRYLKETGVHVPMIIRVPQKWSSLSPFPAGQPVDELVAFVDLAPTLLSLAGAKKPAQMQGRAFLGSQRVEPAAHPGAFLYADRFDEIYGMRRGWTDGRWKYIRHFTPHLPAAPYSYYQFSMPSWAAYRRAWQEGKLDAAHARLWEAPQPVEELFDITNDPWELNNLANDPAQAGRLAELRGKLKQTMIDIRDTGLVPEPMFAALAGQKTIVDYVRSDAFPIQQVVELAFLSGEGKAANTAAFLAAMKSAEPVTRYWGLLGMRVLKNSTGMEAALADKQSANRVLAAENLCVSGQRDAGLQALLAELDRTLDEYSLLNLLNTFQHVNAVDKIPQSWLHSISKNKALNGYVARFMKAAQTTAQQP